MELMAIMAAANSKLDAIQRQHPHSGRKNHGARSPKGSFLGSNSRRPGHDAVQERRFQGLGPEESSGQEEPCIDQGLTVNPSCEALIGSAAAS